MRKWLLIGIGIIVLFLVAFVLTYAHFFGPVDIYAQQTQFLVQENQTTDQIADTLKTEGFIRSRLAFEIALKLVGNNAPILPGGYQLSASMDVWTIAGTMSKPPPFVFFTFPPGWRKEQIADKLATTFGWTAAQKTEWLTVDTDPSPSFVEGVYFPDTYLIASGETPLQVAQQFTTRFQQQFAPYANEASEQGIPWTEVVNMASLIEREAAGPSDMPLIAGIMWNRLNKHMLLQIDATLQYAVGTEADWWPTPTAQDKYVNSPFNTYQHTGLPPHPIDEPSLAAINAVLNPEQTNCLYYLHDSDRQIHCSTTYAGQLANVNKYLK